MDDSYSPKPLVNIILIGDILSVFLLRLETWQIFGQKSLYNTTSALILEILGSTEGKKGNKLSVFAGDLFICLE